MKKLLVALVLCAAAPARASTYSVSTDASSTTLKLAGRFYMPNLSGVNQLVVDSVRGLFTWTYGIQASTASLTGTGNTTYSLSTSSGISVGAGGVTAAFFNGPVSAVARGAVGQILFQTGAAATSFLPAMASAGANAVAFITGTGTSVAPSTATLTGTSNQITITQTGANAVLSTPQNIDSTATPTFAQLTITSIWKAFTTGIQPLVPITSASSMTFTGPTGDLLSGSSITTRGSFFGDGSHISGISGTLSGGSNGFGARWTGATSLGVASFEDNGSSTTFDNKSLVKSTMTFATGVRMSSTSIVSVDTSWTNFNTFANCKSSHTFSLDAASDIRVFFDSSATGDATARCSGVIILLDGIPQNWPTQSSPPRGITGCNASTTAGHIGGFWDILNVSQGAHTVCWGGWSSNNGVTWKIPDVGNTGIPATMTVTQP